MSIAAICRDLKPPFMSLHEVLCRMEKTEAGATYKKCAEALVLLLGQERDAPAWYKRWPHHTLQPWSPQFDLLYQAMSNGVAPVFPWTGNEEADSAPQREYYARYKGLKSLEPFVDSGFEPESIIGFLAKHGVNIRDVQLSVDVNDLAAEIRATWYSSDAWTPGQAEPPADADVTARFVHCTHEREALRHEVAGLLARLERLEPENRRLAETLEKTSAELETATRERDALRGDQLAGKGKTSALKLIGGLAKLQGVTCVKGRLGGVEIGKRLIPGLEQQGCGLDEKTLRRWLQDAFAALEAG